MRKDYNTSTSSYYKVMIHCPTFNHSSFIQDTMNGFCMQLTDFPFICTIFDDNSTDGEQDVIRKYLENNFIINYDTIRMTKETDDYTLIYTRHKRNVNCFFAVYFLKYNHYQLKKSRAPYLLQEWKDTKYIALCEGDDYWTDPYKLQKQVDFLETHPDYTMVCNRTKLYSERKKTFIGENYCYNHNCTIKTKDVIYRSGLFISTCSIIYRKKLKDNYPDYCLKCVVGDYPLQIMAAIKGKIYYFNEAMSVYRIQNSTSWMGKQKWHTADEKNLRRVDSMINMFKGFSNDYPQYKRYFSNKIAHYLISQSPLRFNNTDKDLEYYLQYYHDYYDQFPLFWKIINKLRMTNIPGLRGYYGTYTKPLYNRFRQKIMNYTE